MSLVRILDNVCVGYVTLNVMITLACGDLKRAERGRDCSEFQGLMAFASGDQGKPG